MFERKTPDASPENKAPLLETVHPPEVVMMENHDAACHAWRERGLKDRILVHLDDHHDMGWIESSESLNIANYICPAIQENIVREFYWIVPDPRWVDPKEKAKIVRQVKRIVKGYPGRRPRVKVSGTVISPTILGWQLTVGPLASMPPAAWAMFSAVSACIAKPFPHQMGYRLPLCTAV